MCDLNLSDEALSEKFKRDFNEQFHVLVRMHLSFVLDSNTEDNECVVDKKTKKWFLVPFNKKTKAKGVLEGAPLTQEGICQVYQLIEFLKKEQNLKIEGIFRRTGSLIRQQELRNLLSQGITLELESGTYSVHDCASVLKSFLADLPDPLLTEAHYPAYCQIAELCDVEKATHENKLLLALQHILLLLPTENKVLLKDILDLLHLTHTYQESNLMSADNLAKLFTPHLLCPRKLTPEQLHVDSKILSGIVSFMIRKCMDLFRIPQNLIVEFRALYEKRKLLPKKCLNESVGDQFAANTVFTFIDKERTAKENESNTTETAIAQLYAHIQSLPESSKKRKLVKQFNKENGHGTPLQVIRSGNPKNKSLGDSIKKHIFHKSLKKTAAVRNSNDNTPGAPSITTRARLFCTNCDSSTELNNEGSSTSKKKRLSLENKENIENNIDDEDADDGNDNNKGLMTDHLLSPSTYLLTSTPACAALHVRSNLAFSTPEGQNRKSMSPITRSAQRMPRAMQETMMTPRSRKPVLLVSGTNINSLAKVEPRDNPMRRLSEDVAEDCSSTCSSDSKEDKLSPNILSKTFKNYLESRSMLTTSSPVVDSSFSSRTDDFNSSDFNNISENKMTDSLLHCLNGNNPNDDDVDNTHNIDDGDCSSGKELILKPKQFDENGQPIVFETSF